MKYIFPPMVPVLNPKQIVRQLLAAKALLYKDNNSYYQYVCNCLGRTGGVEAERMVGQMLGICETVTEWYSLNVEKCFVSIPERIAYRHAWIDHMVKELSA